MQEFVRKPALQISEFLSIRLLKSVFSMELFSSLEAAVFKGVKNDKLRKLLCFPVLFLGAKPSETPALYSLMNYADLILGSWYPKGGMIKLFEALYLIAIEKGVQFHFNTAVEKINIENKTVNGIRIAGKDLYFDAVLSTADYHHTDTALVDSKYRQYSNSYWEDRTMAPSALIFYLGINKRIDHLLHHNLFLIQDLKNTLQRFTIRRYGQKSHYFMRAYHLKRILVLHRQEMKIYFYLYRLLQA